MTQTDFRTYGIFLSAALLLILSSCARPQFETKTSFIKPVSAKGLQCVQQAAQTQQSCDQRLKGPYQNCYARATDRARRGYQDALAHYTADKRDYDRCMEEVEYLWQREVDQLHYELVDRVQANNAACGFSSTQCRIPIPGRWEVDDPIARNNYLSGMCLLSPGHPPEMEDFLNVAGCQSPRDICDPVYERDYAACGGTVKKEQVCVANCK